MIYILTALITEVALMFWCFRGRTLYLSYDDKVNFWLISLLIMLIIQILRLVFAVFAILVDVFIIVQRKLNRRNQCKMIFLTHMYI